MHAILVTSAPCGTAQKLDLKKKKSKKTDLRYLSSFRISSSFGEGKAVYHLKSQHRQYTSEPDCFGGVTVSPCYPSANFTVKLDQTSHLI